MKIIISLILFSNLAIGVQIAGFEYSAREIKDIQEGLEQWRAIARNAGSLPAEQAIPQLGKGLRKTSENSIYVVGDRLGVRKELQDALLAIPGHAEYYERKVKAAQKIFEDPATRAKDDGALSHVLYYDFPTLAQLPSPETVRVLGDFLSDHKGVDEEGKALPGHIKGTGPVCTLAAQALMELPLKSKPMPQGYVYFDDVHTWLLWYQQIKAGTRTFSFEGDPNIYSLAGPVKEAKDPGMPRNARREPNPGTRTDNPEAIAGETHASIPTLRSNTPYIVAAVIALSGLGYYSVRRFFPRK